MGEFNQAAIAGPPSPEKPATPVPAIVVTSAANAGVAPSEGEESKECE